MSLLGYKDQQEILAAAKTLPPELQRNLIEELLASLNQSATADKIHQLNQQLLESGLLSEIKPRPSGFVAFVPVGVTGQPVSETIIEERR